MGQARGGLGVVGTQGGYVVAAAVVGPPGFHILILTRKQWTGAPTRPDAFAVHGLGCVSLLRHRVVVLMVSVATRRPSASLV